MKKIYKYTLELIDHQLITMPADAVILCAQMQRGNMCIWAEFDTEAHYVKRPIFIRGTGLEFEEPTCHCYIDTIQHEGMVWHLYAGREVRL